MAGGYAATQRAGTRDAAPPAVKAHHLKRVVVVLRVLDNLQISGATAQPEPLPSHRHSYCDAYAEPHGHAKTHAGTHVCPYRSGS